MATQNRTRTKGRHKVKRVEAFDTILDVANEAEYAVSADVLQLMQFPDNTLIKSMSIVIITPDDAGTSAVLDVGIAGGVELVDGFNLQGSVDVTTTSEGVYLANGGVLTALPVYVGTASTEGKIWLHVEYSVLGKADGNFTQLINS